MAARSRIFFASVALLAASCTGGAVESPPPAGPTSTAAPSVAPRTTTSVSPVAPPTSLADLQLRLPNLQVWAFPGPDHYEGDVLTFQVPLGGFGEHSDAAVELSVDGRPLDLEPTITRDPLLGDLLVFANAFDTTGATGGHWVTVAGSVEPDRTIDITQRIAVKPAAGRPRQELAADWAVHRTDCCNVTYLEDSAAARDLDQVVAVIDEVAGEVEDRFRLKLPRVDFVLIDRLWGNGGYAGSEVVVSYLDRDFSPGRGVNRRYTIMHELVHAITDQLESETPWPLLEGVAVQVTGGHFKEDPLGDRAKALAERGDLPTISELFDTFPTMQHETRYVAAGAFAEYLVATHGFSTLVDVLDSELDAEGSEWLEAAIGEVLDIDLASLEAAFSEWVAGHDATTQSADLDLTIALQEARRAFQVAHDPYPHFFIYPSVTEIEHEALAMREPRSPRLVAVEALIAYAQDLIISGDLEAAAMAVAEVERVVAEGTVGGGLSAEFLEVAEALDTAGYELLAYVPGSTFALATRDAPHLTRISLGVSQGEIVVTASRPVG